MADDPKTPAAWQTYEKQIADRLRQQATGPVKIIANTQLPGKLSGVPRQIDILVEGSFAGIADALLAVDCKCFSSKVDVKDMEAFIGMLGDIQVPLGMLFTTVGFTPAAENRGAAVLQQVEPLINIAVFDQTGSWWLMRAGETGWYTGDYIDHEPYGGFYWRVSFVTGDTSEDEEEEEEEEDVLWASTAGGWEVDEGATLLATLLGRHRLTQLPEAQEIANLATALDREIEDGQGFNFSTRQIDWWMADPDAEIVDRRSW